MQDANGIMGLANSEHNFVEILYKFGAIKKNIFSLCLAQLGGIFNIGEINYKIHKENITFVPMLLDRGIYFGLSIKSISVNDQNITNFNEDRYNILIDSGSTISYINNKIFDEILNLMNEECKKYGKENVCGKYEYHSDFGHCFYFQTFEDLDNAVYNYWPIIHFNVYGYDYKWKGENYVFNISTEKNPGACTGINKSYGTNITLGSNWIIGHDIIFDRDNELIGIAEAECYQNKILNISNGIELKDEIINLIKNGTQNISTLFRNKKNESKYKNYSGLKYPNIKILRIVSICLLSLIFLIVITISMMLCRQNIIKDDLGIKNDNKFSKNEKEYIEVDIHNMKEESNTIDIV